MIDTGRFCIDSTEVTRGQYQAFMDDVGNDAGAYRPPDCENDAGVQPEKGRPTDNLDFPIDFIDWCDAKTFCSWAGKRLCGRIGGGANAWTAHDDEDMSQWYAACSADGARVFPYGNDYVADACNGMDYDPGLIGSSLPVMALADTCEGGFPGLYDMSGNVREWTDNCQTSNDNCSALGGSFGLASGKVGVKCSSRSQFEWWSKQLGLGFRCCADYE